MSKISKADACVKRTVAVLVCQYDCGERWLFREKYSDGTWQTSKCDYPSEEWCRMIIEGLQTELGCAPDAPVFHGGWHLPKNWKDRKFQHSYASVKTH